MCRLGPAPVPKWATREKRQVYRFCAEVLRKNEGNEVFTHLGSPLWALHPARPQTLHRLLQPREEPKSEKMGKGQTAKMVDKGLQGPVQRLGKLKYDTTRTHSSSKTQKKRKRAKMRHFGGLFYFSNLSPWPMSILKQHLATEASVCGHFYLTNYFPLINIPGWADWRRRPPSHCTCDEETGGGGGGPGGAADTARVLPGILHVHLPHLQPRRDAVKTHPQRLRNNNNAS